MNAPREPRVFAPGDPALVVPPEDRDAGAPEDRLGDGEAGALVAEPAGERMAARLKKGTSWGSLLIASLSALAALAASLSFARFVSVALERQDWIGWTATGLLALAALAALVFILREVVGLLRLSRLSRLRADVETALRTHDTAAEQRAVRALRALFRGRPDLKWSLARLRDHERDVRDAGELLRLADREVLAGLDTSAKRVVLKSAKRVSVVTAMSPIVWAAMLFVVVENLRMLRALASLYGGRPGGIGALRLGRMVLAHILATGGLAMTDDLLGQFLGQDLLRRLSRRLGEGAFNGALTARIGTAAVEVVRPLPFLDAEPVRVRDLLPELFRSLKRPQPKPTDRVAEKS